MEIVAVTPADPLFDAWAQVTQAVHTERWGRHSTAYPTDELRALWDEASTHRIGFAALVGGVVVGAARVAWSLRDNPHLASAEIDVLREHRRIGAGSALLEAVEAAMRESGRTTLLIEESTPAGQLEEGAPFLRSRGFTLAQRCVRNGQLLPVGADIERAMRAALDIEDDYVIETAVDGLPEAWLDERARLTAMMSTDTPLGGIALEPETWDADRVREIYATARAQGRRVVDAVAWHRPTGRIVAFTHVSVPRETPWIAYQDDTLVETTHRGHGLGYRVKAAVALTLPQIAPDVEVQRTWNDETNVHMLRINRELGYAPEGTMCEWQKVLDGKGASG